MLLYIVVPELKNSPLYDNNEFIICQQDRAPLCNGMQVLDFISNHLPEWIGQCSTADYGPWITKTHAVRFFSVAHRVAFFF